MLSRLELQRFQKNCFDAVFQYVRYADLYKAELSGLSAQTKLMPFGYN